MDPLPYATDQIIDAAMACSLHDDACREHALVAWVVMWDAPGYSDRLTARLATDGPSPYLLLAEDARRHPDTAAAWSDKVRADAG